MKIILEGDNAISLRLTAGMMSIEAEHSDQSYSPFHMLGSALALCTFNVLHSWAHHSELDVSDLVIRVEWEFADHPHRVSAIRSHIQWPGLPPARKTAVERAAALCAVHATLAHPPVIATSVEL